jgi:hypothetical protein
MVQGRRRRSGHNQMNGVFNYTSTFANGWTLGTQPNLSVDWKARGDEGVAFSIGPLVGKMCKMRRHADAVPSAVRVLPGSSQPRGSEVEYSAASDSDNPSPHQETALLTVGKVQLELRSGLESRLVELASHRASHLSDTVTSRTMNDRTTCLGSTTRITGAPAAR